MCVYEVGLLLLFAYIALLLLPLSFVLGVGAPSLSLVGFIFVIEAVRRGSLSFSWFVVASATRQVCCLFAHVALLLLPFLSFFLGVGSPSLSLAGFMLKAVRRGSLSFSLFIVALAACVYETGLLLVCACRTSAAPLSLLLGVRAPSLPLVGFMF